MFIEFPEICDLIVEGIEDIKIPKMVRITQKYDTSHIHDIPSHIKNQMDKLQDKEFYQGKRICITAGSRGIPDLDIVIRTICQTLREWGAVPFVIPAMGSHGGASAEGQREVLTSYNITPQSVGAEVLSCMDVVEYGRLTDGTPLYCDKNAMESDGIVVLNKVKPHTDFRAEHESGMAKMIAIGLGKHKGASLIHSLGFARFPRLIGQVAEIFLQKAPVCFGVGIVQNAYDKLCLIDVVSKDQIIQRDKELLTIARKHIADFKFDETDVMVIDEIGKNISGYGFDPNILGRSNSSDYGVNDPVKIKRMIIRGLTPESQHNGSGITAADISTRKCLNNIDWSATWINLITATEIQGGKIPMYVNNDKEAILLAIRCCSGIDRNRVKISRIKNSLAMHEIMVSEALWDDMKHRDDVVIMGDPFYLNFNKNGDLIN